MREWRKEHKLNDLQKIKANARTRVHVHIKRGKLVKLPCEKCGNENVEAHHDDYSKPLDVRWLCRFHHNEHHRLQN
jgi:ribosomal protein S27AE